MWAAIAAAVAMGVAGVAKLLDTSDEEERRQRMLALQEFGALSSPEVRNLIAEGVKESAFKNIKANQGQRAIQDETQARLLEKGRANGLDLQARAKLEEAGQNAAQYERQQRQGILDSARARGTAGSGEELMARLAAEQGGADSLRMAGVQAAADADERALQSFIQAGDMARQREDADWNRAAQVASAEDDIAKFNAGENNRFAIYNDQQRWNKADYDLRLAQSRANARTGYANYVDQQGKEDLAMWGGVGQGVGYGIQSAGDYYGSQKQGATAPQSAAPAAPQVIQARQPVPGSGQPVQASNTTPRSTTRRRAS